MNGREKLLAICNISGDEASVYSLDKMKIEKRALDRGIELYEMAIWKFLGNSLITRLKNTQIGDQTDIREALRSDTATGKGYWVDLSGMICPFEALDQLLVSIENAEITSLEEVNAALAVLHKNYYNYEWTWAVGVIEKFYGKSVDDFMASDVIFIVEKMEEKCVGNRSLPLRRCEKGILDEQNDRVWS